MPKLPKPQKYGGNRAINYSMNLWQRGYIKSRLQQKCREQSVEIVEVFAKILVMNVVNVVRLDTKRMSCFSVRYVDIKQNVGKMPLKMQRIVV